MVVATSDFELTESAPGVRALATARALGDELRRLPVTSASGFRPVPSSPATSVPKTVTSTRLSAMRSTRQRGLPIAPRRLMDGCCATARLWPAPKRLSYGAGLRAVRRYYAAAPRRRSFPLRSPTPRSGGLSLPRRDVPQRHRAPVGHQRLGARQAGTGCRTCHNHTAHMHLTCRPRVSYIAQWGIRVYDFAHGEVRHRCAGAHSHW